MENQEYPNLGTGNYNFKPKTRTSKSGGFYDDLYASRTPSRESQLQCRMLNAHVLDIATGN